MNSNCSGVRHPPATTVDLPTTATTLSSRPASSSVRRNVGKVSKRPVTVVDQRRVVVLPPGLMLLGAVVVVDGVEHAVTRLRRRTQQHRRFAAVRADLHADAVVEVAQRRVMQGLALVGGHEAGDPLGQCEQPAGAARRGQRDLRRSSSPEPVTHPVAAPGAV